MFGMNSGYVGWSMSKRAKEAYENGEMPKSKWTKAAMLAEIAAYFDEPGMGVEESARRHLEKLTKAELFGRFFIRSSWHHTSKCLNETDFYSLDEEELAEYVDRPTAREYRIEYLLGTHQVVGRRKFDTMAKAERHLLSRGFNKETYAWRRGRFFADIRFDKIDV